jgi:5-(aminomethyl)-3-furanmethanol phosphate kinase
MVVIKLGGSLLASGKLRACLDKIELDYQGRTVVLVPGGGVFAEQVRKAQREWEFDDVAAHRMAILAMQQLALIVNAFKPQISIVSTIEVKSISENILPSISIWSPDIAELDQAGIPNSWGITSDSLSAWLAGRLGANELIVVKSVNINEEHTVQELVKLQIVDAEFCHYLQPASCKTTVVNAEKFLS